MCLIIPYFWALPKGRALHYIFFVEKTKKDAVPIPNADLGIFSDNLTKPNKWYAF
ncbi:MAG: hypothetical protein ACWIPI_01705 [Polaribacter sp.]